MYQCRKHQYGFSLIELLIVMAIFGVFIGSVYSLYVAHLKTALTREEVVDVQQNVRIAMDQITRDLRMAGFLFPAPVASGLSNYSSAISIQTASAEGTFVAINTVINDSKISVTPPAMLVNFTPGTDTVGIYRPSTKTRIGGVFSVLSSSAASGHMNILPAADPDSLRVGDMICKTPNGIQYLVDHTDTSQGCDKAPCLKRNGTVIAQGIDKIHFDYFTYTSNTSPTLYSSTSTTDDLGKITAIQATVTGITSKKSGPDDTTKSRILKSLIKLRNYK